MPSPFRVADVGASWSHYGVATGLALLALQARVVLFPLNEGHPFVTFYPVVAAASYFLGIGPGALVAVIGALTSWYFLIPPTWSFALELDGIFTLAVYVAACGAITLATLAVRAKVRRG